MGELVRRGDTRLTINVTGVNQSDYHFDNQNDTMDEEVNPNKSVFRVIREKLGELERGSALSQQEFATRLGAGVATVNRWERGKQATFTVPQLKRLKQMLDTLGWDIEDLPDDSIFRQNPNPKET
jgi:DNA-binding transcriptional regulator YiaG